MAEVELHPLAIAEARAARRAYSRASPILAARFMAELDAAIARIAANPPGYRPRLHGTRLTRFLHFPYLMVYLELTPDRVVVVAVAHGLRKPGYWRRRLP